MYYLLDWLTSIISTLGEAIYIGFVFFIFNIVVLVVYETCIHYEFPSFLSTQTTQPLVDDLPITTKAQTILPIPQETG